jgi:hypothetical protein
VLSQVGNGEAQAGDEEVEDGTEVSQVRLTAEGVEEAREVPGVGYLRDGSDAVEAAQRRVAVQLGEAGLEAEMSQHDGEQDDAPEAFDGEVVTAFAARGAECVEEFLVRQDLEELAKGGELGMVFEAEPGEERIGDEQVHG